MRWKLDQCQSHLFKRILGVPMSTADEIVFLLTGLIPISQQIDMNRLLLLGQVLNLSQGRFEVKTFLHAYVHSTPTIIVLKELLATYHLPDLDFALDSPPTYTQWKQQVKCAVHNVVGEQVVESLNKKSSLGFWKGKTDIRVKDLYPSGPVQDDVRQALIVRAQLLSGTYMVQVRKNKIGKDNNLLCPLCKDEKETVEHFVASCIFFEDKRDDLKLKASQLLEDHSWYAEQLFNSTDYLYLFTQAILLPFDPRLPMYVNSLLLKLSLLYLSHIHKSRSNALELAL